MSGLAKVPINKLFVPNLLHVKTLKFESDRQEARYQIAKTLNLFSYRNGYPKLDKIALCELDGFTDLFYHPTYVVYAVNTTCPHCKKAIALRRMEGRELPR